MNANMAITYGPVGGFPLGTVLDHLRMTITGVSTPAQSQSVPPNTSPIVFASVPADTYTYLLESIDSTGAVLATRGGSFTVAAPATVTLQLPGAVTVTVT